MPDQQSLPAREYPTSDAAMIVGIGAITTAALEHQPVLEEEDTTFTKPYLEGLKARIDAAATGILGHDNAKELRNATTGIRNDTGAALEALGSMLNTINNKYRGDAARRDEILTRLGYTPYYNAASHKDQQALGQLLSRAAAALAADNGALATELTGKGMNRKRIDAVASLAAFTTKNTAQEATKGSRKLLTAADVKVLNALYHDVMEVAKTARHFFADNSALRSLFVFSKVAPPSHGGGDNPAGGSTDAAAPSV